MPRRYGSTSIGCRRNGSASTTVSSDVGFNYQQPGKVKKADLAIFIGALVVIAALVIWAIW